MTLYASWSGWISVTKVNQIWQPNLLVLIPTMAYTACHSAGPFQMLTYLILLLAISRYQIWCCRIWGGILLRCLAGWALETIKAVKVIWNAGPLQTFKYLSLGEAIVRYQNLVFLDLPWYVLQDILKMPGRAGFMNDKNYEKAFGIQYYIIYSQIWS